MVRASIFSRRHFSRVLFAAAAGFLAACKPIVTAEIHLEDVLAISAEPETSGEAAARIVLPLSDVTACERSWDDLKAVLDPFFAEAEAASCGSDVDGAVTLEIETALPMTANAADWRGAGDQVLGLLLQRTAERVQVDVLYNEVAMSKLALSLSAHLGTPVDFDTPELVLMLHRDEPGLGFAQLSGALVEGEPAIQFRQFLVPHGYPVRVDVGSVKIVHLIAKGFVPVVQVVVLEGGDAVEETPTNL